MPSQGFLYGQFLETVGIELEGEGLHRSEVGDRLSEKLSNFYDALPINITRDASTECNVYVTRARGSNAPRTLGIYTHSPIANLIAQRGDNISQYGYELVINPTVISELKPLLQRVEDVLISAGDFTTDRSATHYHIGFAHNLKYLRRLLAVCLHIDPLLYRLGGMGRTFRGYANNSAYARPLMNSAAVPVGQEARISSRRGNESRIPRFSIASELSRGMESGRLPDIREEDSPPSYAGGYVQIINPLRALEAKSTDEFWSCFGVFPSITGLNKYHPARYMGCNFYALTQHGTMEFRHFNQSLDYELIFLVAKFLRATVEMSTFLTKNELGEFTPGDSNQEISMDDAERIMYNLQKFFNRYDIENSPTDGEIAYLLDVTEKSSFKEIPVTPVLTHNREYVVPSNLTGNLLPVKGPPLPPTHVDIHTLSEKVSSLLGDFK